MQPTAKTERGPIATSGPSLLICYRTRRFLQKKINPSLSHSPPPTRWPFSPGPRRSTPVGPGVPAGWPEAAMPLLSLLFLISPEFAPAGRYGVPGTQGDFKALPARNAPACHTGGTGRAAAPPGHQRPADHAEATRDPLRKGLARVMPRPGFQGHRVRREQPQPIFQTALLRAIGKARDFLSGNQPMPAPPYFPYRCVTNSPVYESSRWRR